MNYANYVVLSHKPEFC